MSVAAAKNTGSDDTTWGNKRVRPRRLTFSSTYTTGGEPIAASLFGLTKIEQLLVSGGVAMASALTTGCGVGWDQVNGKMVFYETGASSGTALSEKTSAEAYPTGCFLDVTAIGH